MCECWSVVYALACWQQLAVDSLKCWKKMDRMVGVDVGVGARWCYKKRSSEWWGLGKLSIHRTDHENVVARRAPHPNYVWHIDGHHKLGVLWSMVQLTASPAPSCMWHAPTTIAALRTMVFLTMWDRGENVEYCTLQLCNHREFCAQQKNWAWCTFEWSGSLLFAPATQCISGFVESWNHPLSTEGTTFFWRYAANKRARTWHWKENVYQCQVYTMLNFRTKSLEEAEDNGRGLTYQDSILMLLAYNVFGCNWIIMNEWINEWTRWMNKHDEAAKSSNCPTDQHQNQQEPFFS